MPKQIFHILFKAYGPQGWWPLLSHKGSNPTKTGSVAGYHPGDYSFPKNKQQQFEICIGAILTQNTSWPQVETALKNLQELKITTPKALLTADEELLKQAIKPAGYFNQKAMYLKELAGFFQEVKEAPTREQLLAIKGIGQESADSMLLYAFNQPQFVVDAYTRRIFTHLNHVKEKASYDDIKAYFEQNMPKDVKTYQEFHALIVEHAKRHYKKKPYNDPLLE